MFANSISIPFGSCYELNVFTCGILTIDAFQTSADSGNKLQRGGFIHKILVDFKSTANNYSLIVMDFGFNFFFSGCEIFVIGKAGLLQLFQKQRMVAVDMEDFYGFRFQVVVCLDFKVIKNSLRKDYFLGTFLILFLKCKIIFIKYKSSNVFFQA